MSYIVESSSNDQLFWENIQLDIKTQELSLQSINQQIQQFSIGRNKKKGRQNIRLPTLYNRRDKLEKQLRRLYREKNLFEERNAIEIPIDREEDERIERELDMQMEFMRKVIGLSAERIAKFETFPAKKNFKCGCCFEELQAGEMLVRLDCKHAMCKECTDKWLSQSNTCPFCRHVFEKF